MLCTKVMKKILLSENNNCLWNLSVFIFKIVVKHITLSSKIPILFLNKNNRTGAVTEIYSFMLPFVVQIEV